MAVLAVAGCGASETAVQAADASAAETAFRSYHRAVLARDFSTACALNAPETSAVLVDDVARLGGQARTCDEALAALYATPAVAARYDAASRSVHVDGVSVAGDTATIRWTFDNKGRPEPVDTGLRRIEGRWRLLAAR